MNPGVTDRRPQESIWRAAQVQRLPAQRRRVVVDLDQE
jgi:hypothetical protein